MHRFLVVISAIVLAGCQASAPRPESARQRTDSLLSYINITVDSLFSTLEFKRAEKILDSIYPLVDSLDDFTLRFSWLNSKATQLTGTGDFTSARDTILRSMQYALEKDSTRRLYLSAEAKYADWLVLHDSLRQAITYYEDAYYLAMKIDTVQMPSICYALVGIYNELKNYPAVRKYLDEGWRFSHQNYGSDHYKSIFAVAYLSYYADINQPDSALQFYHRAIGDSSSFAVPYFTGVINWNLGEVYFKKKDYNRSLQHRLEGLASIRNYDTLTPVLYYNIAEGYYYLKEYKKATQYVDSALQLAIKKRSWDHQSGSWELLGKISEAQQRYGKGYAALDSALHTYKIYTDSSMAKYVKELQTQYQVRAKDDKITALATLNAANHKISRQQRTIIVGMVITGLLTAASTLLWYRRRQLRIQLREITLHQQLLRTQMEPHFVFNTLASLQAYIFDDDKKKALLYFSKFSKLLRMSLQNARRPFVKLQDELDALEGYLGLQATQSGDAFSYQIVLDDYLQQNDVYIPPMLLQPFVENAVLHGFEKLHRKGHIDINISCTGTVLRCIIDDNGNGISGPPRSVVFQKNRTSLSTAITKERLQILAKYSHQPAGVTIQDKGIDQGVRVTIIIPYRHDA